MITYLCNSMPLRAHPPTSALLPPACHATDELSRGVLHQIRNHIYFRPTPKQPQLRINPSQPQPPFPHRRVTKRQSNHTPTTSRKSPTNPAITLTHLPHGQLSKRTRKASLFQGVGVPLKSHLISILFVSSSLPRGNALLSIRSPSLRSCPGARKK